MKFLANSRILGLLVALTLLVTPAMAIPAASQDSGIYLEILSDAGGTSQTIKLSMATDRLRVDTDQGISIVSIGGDNGKMLMIQHAEKQYMEFTDEMMKAFAGMMGQMPPEVQAEIDAAAGTPPTFTRTGNTKQVGEWSAYEVLVEHPEQDGETKMWMSQDVDADFQTLAEQLVSSLSSFLSSPMMAMGGGGGGGMTGMFSQMQEQMQTIDFPDGFPVQIISDAGGDESVTTLQAIDQNASFGADAWDAPAGYSKMAMPFIR